LVASRRLGTVEDYGKFVDLLATDLTDYVIGGAVNGGLAWRRCEKTRSDA
jgi:hypothetical protein